MNLAEYRRAVIGAAPCPAPQCGAARGEPCSNTYGQTNPVRKVIDYVHDDRSLEHLLLMLADPATVVTTNGADEVHTYGIAMPDAQPEYQGLCPACRGSGGDPNPSGIVGGPCPRCGGRGRVDELAHSAACVAGDKDPDCPSFFILAHSDGDHHCRDCHGLTGPDGPYCSHIAGCPGC